MKYTYFYLSTCYMVLEDEYTGGYCVVFKLRKQKGFRVFGKFLESVYSIDVYVVGMQR